MKRLEIYTNEINLISEKTIFELKLQYWTVKELYFSPYKVYLNTMTRTKFLLKFLQTQKYITIDSEDKLTDFVSYFIKILREDFEKGENNNANFHNCKSGKQTPMEVKST